MCYLKIVDFEISTTTDECMLENRMRKDEECSNCSSLANALSDDSSYIICFYQRITFFYHLFLISFVLNFCVQGF